MGTLTLARELDSVKLTLEGAEPVYLDYNVIRKLSEDLAEIRKDIYLRKNGQLEGVLFEYKTDDYAMDL